MIHRILVWACVSTLFAGVILAGGFSVAFDSFNPYAEINMSYPSSRESLTVPVRGEKNERVTLRAFVGHSDGTASFLKDADGRDAWNVRLDDKGEGALSIRLSDDTFTGKVMLSQGAAETVETPETIEKIYEYRFGDGAKIKVHYTDQMLEAAHEDAYFAKDVLDAAVSAYQTITQFEGFSAPGYAFAHPDKRYAYDPDGTIDVYLGLPMGDASTQIHGFNASTFKDAPCFDTVRVGPHEYQAVILLPANYREFIKNWERINPSPLGSRDVNVDLRGTLIHEMLHAVLFYYNKNLNKALDGGESAAANRKKIDWYVEGLARYFETFAGAKHDFYSQGFRQTLPDKIRFSRGGSNYFMRYPDQAFTDLRYENAIFWRFIDYRFGMGAIEKLSRDVRAPADFKTELEKVTGQSFKELLKRYAASILFKDFGLKEDAVYLKDIARTRLNYRGGALYLVDGYGKEKFLGEECRTDWIGRWGDAAAAIGQPPVAGDNTDKSDVSPWATDFFEIAVDPGEASLPWLGISHLAGGMPLTVQIFVVTKGGSVLRPEMADVPSGGVRGVSLKDFCAAQGLAARDIEKMDVLITNTDDGRASDYQINVKA